MTAYKKHSPEEFFDWLSKGRVLEIRFLSDYLGTKFNNWPLIERLAEMMGVEKRYNSLFITSYKELKAILLFKLPLLGKEYPLTRLYNIFIGVNPKRKVKLKSKNGLLYDSYYGGIAGTSHIQTVLCDIEHVGERPGNATEAMIDECIQGAKYLVKILELGDYWINVSGNGVHLWIAMEPAIELPIPSFREINVKGKDTVKYNLKEEPINTHIKTYNRFVEQLDRNLKEFNPKLKVDDGAKDIARIARPPGSWNVKAKKTARAVGTVAKDNQINKVINKSFMAAKPLLSKESQDYKRIKVQSKLHRYNVLNIRESPLYKLMVSRLLPSTLSRNHFLEQSFSRILRDNDIEEHEISEVVSEMDAVQQKTVQVDPDYLDDDLPFNAETVNSYCYKCEVDFVYDIMEDIPVIVEGFIDDERYENLNSYGVKTIEAMITSKMTLQAPNSYFELKSLIRNLVDQYSRSTVFFTVKFLLIDDWAFLHKNKVVLKIMNKTRRRKE